MSFNISLYNMEIFLDLKKKQKTKNMSRYRIKRSFNISLYNTEIYLDSYTALMSVLDSPNGSSNTGIKAVYSSKYISVLYSEMLNNLILLGFAFLINTLSFSQNTKNKL